MPVHGPKARRPPWLRNVPLSHDSSCAFSWKQQFLPGLCQPLLIVSDLYCTQPQMHYLLWHKLEDAQMHEATSLTSLIAFLQIIHSCGIYNVINSLYWGQTGSTASGSCSIPLPLDPPLIPPLHWNCKVFGAKTSLLFWVWTALSPVRSQTVTWFLLLMQHKHLN